MTTEISVMYGSEKVNVINNPLGYRLYVDNCRRHEYQYRSNP